MLILSHRSQNRGRRMRGTVVSLQSANDVTEERMDAIDFFLICLCYLLSAKIVV